VGETPDGVRMQFRVKGAIDGPRLKGEFPHGTAAFLRIDPDGVGTIHVRAPLLISDGALAELQATGRYDFGDDGYRRAAAGDLPDSALGWCPRFVTSDPRYLWLNRTLFLGVGELLPKQTRVDYDLFAMSPREFSQPGAESTKPRASGKSLYERLGSREGIDQIAGAFVDRLYASKELHRQNPRVALAHERVRPDYMKVRVAELVCQLVGGPCEYAGRPLKEVHDPLHLTEADWSIAERELSAVLKQLGIIEADQTELLTIVKATKPQIVRGAMPHNDIFY
jgi:truncated hemoglobin YjbI